MIRLLFCGFLLFAFGGEANAFQPQGVYRAKWVSNSTGHQGPMRVRIRPRRDGAYNARFTGRFAKVIPFSIRTTMTPVSTYGSQTTLVAERRIPIFGSYRMRATVTPSSLNANYDATVDQGYFMMRRLR